MAEIFERTLGYWGRDYAAQMLRGPGSPWRRMVRDRSQLDRVIFEEIDRRRASGERGSDILSLLLDAEDEDGSSLSRQELRDQVMTLLFAGHDTTTSTVTFLFYELARSPDEIAPLLAEQESVLGGEAPSAAQLMGELPRLEMAVDETLRMYPPAWIGPRRSIEPFELAACGCPVECSSTTARGRAITSPRCFPSPGASCLSASHPTSERSCPRAHMCPSGVARAPASGCASANSKSRRSPRCC